MIPRILWLLHLQLDMNRSRVNNKWPREKGFVIQTIKMLKASRLVRITVQPEVEPVEHSNTLALLPMAFLPAWMALEKIVETSEVAAGTADSTLMECPPDLPFHDLGSPGGSRGRQERGCAASCWLLGSQEWFPAHCSSLCLPLGSAGIPASPWDISEDGWGLVLQAMAPSAHSCGAGRVQDIAGHQTLNLQFLKG